MRHWLYIVTLTLVLVSCGTRRGYFRLEGQLLNLNQGEFYVYSTTGAIDGRDTIRVEGGRFAYEVPCTKSGTLVIVFPNFSEQPVFAEPNKTVTMKGDASHLKEIEITGTADNELMNSLRQQLAKAAPKEQRTVIEAFVKANAASPVGLYVLCKYCAPTSKADIANVLKLAEVVKRAQPGNATVETFIRHLNIKKNGETGTRLPVFFAKDINGNKVSPAQLQGRVAVVYTWASWNYDSRNMRDKLRYLKEFYGERLALVSVNVDASASACRQLVKRDSTTTFTVCDEQMFECPLLYKFGLTDIPDNVLYNAQGVMIERSLDIKELEAKIRTLLD